METSQSPAPAHAPQPGSTSSTSSEPAAAPVPEAHAQRLNYLFRRTTAGNQIQMLKKAIHEYRRVPLP